MILIKLPTDEGGRVVGGGRGEDWEWGKKTLRKLLSTLCGFLKSKSKSK